jgi:hypothetical protein
MCHRPIPHRLQRSAARRRSGQRRSTRTSTELSAGGEPHLADQAEAFVRGELAELLVTVGRPLPSWLALNRLGHASPQVLTRVARGQAGVGAGTDPGWADDERALAVRLLNGRRDPDDVRRLQREVLVPLELRLIAESRVEPLTVGQVIRRAIEALDEIERPGPSRT